ncbi:MAG: HD-GYP domain-containing protein [Anaerolineae bacterium]|nr:MAG: HD-GYP domain-containing protein [Anaerolineae bacterium]
MTQQRTMGLWKNPANLIQKSLPPLRLIRGNLQAFVRFVVLTSVGIGILALPWVSNLGNHLLGVVVAVGIALAVEFVSRRNTLLSVLVMIFFTWAAISSLVFFSGGSESPFFIVFLAVVLLSSVFLGRLGGVISLGLTVLSALAILRLEADGVQLPLNIQYDISDQWIVLGMSFFIVFGSSVLMSNTIQLTTELQDSYDQTLMGYARALEARDGNTREHSDRVVALTMQLALQYGFSNGQLEAIRRGALLHDIGKIGISDGILRKPESLSDAERGEMRKHPEIARNLLAGIKFLEGSVSIPIFHHERWDGSGYPQGLKGEDIPLEARIFAVVDVWDALTSKRPYREAWDSAKARAYLREHAGTLFDPEVVERFLKLIN